jgi:uncharacterized protein YfaS (alpha-2-macroglobulin family)
LKDLLAGVRRVFGAVAGALFVVGALLVAAVALLASLIFGTVRWTPPAWTAPLGRGIDRLGAKAAPHKTRLIVAAFALAAAGIAGWYVYPAAKREIAQRYEREVKPVQPTTPSTRYVNLNVTPPAATDVENNGAPKPVTVDFNGSVAPLAKVGQEAPDVSLLPAHPGKWVWTSDHRLEFTPGAEWPIDTAFRIALGPKALAANVSVNDPKRTNSAGILEFRTARFEVTVGSAEFYQDPVQYNIRRAVFDVAFSHPVVPAEFEKRLRLVYSGNALEGLDFSKPGLKYTISYNKSKTAANIQSEPLPIPTEPSPLALQIEAGLKPQREGNELARNVLNSITVPGLFGMTVASVEANIVTAENGEPEHVLQITAGMAVNEKEMPAAVSAWVLPLSDDPKAKTTKVAEGKAWDDPTEVTDAILKRATKVALGPIAQEREATETHAFRFAADPGRYMLVRIAKGLKSAGGYQLGAASDVILKVKAFAPELAILSSGSLLAVNGDKKLPILVRDLPGMQVEIGRILPQQLHLLVSQTDGGFAQPEFVRGITPDNLTERFEKKVPLKLRPGKSHYETIDFGQYLKAGGGDGRGEKRGIFLLSVKGFDPKSGAAPDMEQGFGRRRVQEYGNTEGEDQGEGEGEPPPEEQIDPTSESDRRLVLVTDMGMLVKRALDGTQDVFVQSISSGQPVANALIEVWGKNGLVLTTQTTDAQGRARLNSLAGYVREKAPVLLVAKKGDDLSFMPLGRADRSLDVSRFDVGGVRDNGLPNQTRAYVFSDRGIYRPGDTMNFGIVGKSSDWTQSAADLPVEAQVIDARGQTVMRQKLKLGSGGMTEFSYTTLDTQPTGNYTINVNLGRDGGDGAKLGAPQPAPLQLGTVTVKVQEFMPDRMKVEARLSKDLAPGAFEGWLNPGDLKARVSAQNLFGTPAPNRKVESVLTLTPAYPAFRAFADYSFFDPQRSKERFTDTLAEGATNEQGELELDLGLHRYAKATYQLHLLTRAFEPEGGRSVAAETTALISDLPYLIGFKADGDLAYVAKDAQRKVNLIAIDSNARRTAVKDLHLQRVERRVLSVLVKQKNGLYKYESRKKEVLLKDEPLNLAATDHALTLASDTPGNYAYVIKDGDGLERNRIEYTVAGIGNVSRSLDRNAELQMSLNKKDYAPGEDIEINIRAPYAGAGLITIERDKVYQHVWFKADKTASVQKITLPKNYEGNGYVMVQFVRDPASDEIYTSPLSYGIAPFATSLAARTAKLKLDAPALVKPGETVTMRLESAQPSRAVVFAVDEGILQVARYKNPDPLGFFFRKRALELSTAQTLDLILPEFKKLMAQAAPGGDADGEAGKHLNPFKRKRDKPAVFWSGVVDVDASGKSFTYAVPESFNGSLRVMAVAVNESTTAAATTATTVRGDLVLLPNVPVALTPGDEVDIGVGLANNVKGSGKQAPIDLKLSVSPHLEIVGDGARTLKINERGEASTNFRIRARSGEAAILGSASVIFTAQYKDSARDVSAKHSTDLSLRPASAYVTLVQSGRVRGAGEVAMQGNFYPQQARGELAVSTTPWSFASGLTRYLNDYPYGCTEQIVSQMFPTVLLSARPEVAKLLLAEARAGKASGGAAVATRDPKKALERTLAVLRSRQTADGGFGLYTPGEAAHPFATVHAVHMLVEARDRKLAVPEDMFGRNLAYLQAYLGGAVANDRRYYYDDRFDWRTKTEAAYLLTRSGVVTTAALVQLRQAVPGDRWRNASVDLGQAYLAASYQQLGQDKIAQELIGPVWRDLLERVEKDAAYASWGWYYDPMTHDAMLIALVARHFPARLKDLPTQAFDRIAKWIADGWYSSLSSAAVILAVDAYSNAAADQAAGNLSADAIDLAGKAQPLSLADPRPLARVALAADTARLKLANSGDLPLWYTISETGFEKNPPTAAAINGIEIIRQFVDAKGEPLTEVQLGDEVTVRVRVRAVGRESVQQVALVDVLPGGLEPVLNGAADGEDSSGLPAWRRRIGGAGAASWSWNIEYADVREDRVIFFGDIGSTITELTYKARATNVGSFVVPAAYGEAMYERKVTGRSEAARIVVKPR